MVRLIFGNRPEPIYELNGFDKLDGPYILLSNHESFNDFYYLYKLPHKRKPLYVVNRYYCTMPFLSFLSRRVGMIPKKLFFDDMVTPVRIMRTLKKGFPVIIYPEGRLSIDGRTNRLTEGGGAFYRRLGVHIVLVRVNGAFYEKPKWRKRRYLTPVSVTVERIITKEEAASMSHHHLF
jgi:1-acyl-sn-glycerol-3-phosphate acyltransferase